MVVYRGRTTLQVLRGDSTHQYLWWCTETVRSLKSIWIERRHSSVPTVVYRDCTTLKVYLDRKKTLISTLGSVQRLYDP